ncbi:hypothetical protein AAC387_Pa03g2007 [Persea americana]
MAIHPHKTLSPCRAFVTTRLKNQIHNIIIDINNNTFVSNCIYDGYGYPIPTSKEEVAMNLLSFLDMPFLQYIKKRGLDIAKVVGETFLVRWFGESKGKRVAKIRSFYT